MTPEIRRRSAQACIIVGLLVLVAFVYEGCTSGHLHNPVLEATTCASGVLSVVCGRAYLISAKRRSS